MSKTNSVSEVAEILNNNDNFAILTHQYPDGDTLGSAYALCEVLQQIGKNAKVLVNGDLPEKYMYLTKGINNLEFKAESFVSVDVADRKLLGELEIYADKVILAVDHHETHRPFSNVYYVKSDSASNCENMFYIFKEMNVRFTRTICNALYTGIATDTGCFKYQNVTSDTHMISAELMKYGCDSYDINKAMFDTHSKNKKAIEAFVISNMSYYHNDEIAFAYTTKKMQEQFGVDDEDIQGISAIPRTIEGVKIGVTLRERDNGIFKVSMRTNNNIDASAICNKFDGGGHKAAAGCSIKGTVEQIREILLPVLYEFLD